MAILQMNPEQSKAIHAWIHKEFAKKAGLLEHEYTVQFDSDMVNEVEIRCGKQILILCKYPPYPPYLEDFKSAMRRVFSRIDLRQFIRSQALVRATDAIKWRSLKVHNLTNETKDQRKVTVNSYDVRYVTILEVVDKKTRAKVEVGIEGSAFEALNKALKILYGDKLK